jgi:hypothetical protein
MVGSIFSIKYESRVRSFVLCECFLDESVLTSSGNETEQDLELSAR